MGTRTLSWSERAVSLHPCPPPFSGPLGNSAASNFANRTREVGRRGTSPSDHQVKQHASLIAAHRDRVDSPTNASDSPRHRPRNSLLAPSALGRLLPRFDCSDQRRSYSRGSQRRGHAATAQLSIYYTVLGTPCCARGLDRGPAVFMYTRPVPSVSKRRADTITLYGPGWGQRRGEGWHKTDNTVRRKVGQLGE